MRGGVSALQARELRLPPTFTGKLSGPADEKDSAAISTPRRRAVEAKTKRSALSGEFLDGVNDLSTHDREDGLDTFDFPFVIMCLVPHMESIVSLAFLTAAGAALAGWVAAGSERVGYDAYAVIDASGTFGETKRITGLCCAWFKWA